MDTRQRHGHPGNKGGIEKQNPQADRRRQRPYPIGPLVCHGRLAQREAYKHKQQNRQDTGPKKGNRRPQGQNYFRGRFPSNPENINSRGIKIKGGNEGCKM
jgi:hypothetical protein